MAGRRDLTEALEKAAAGSSAAVDDLFDGCYGELRRLAHRYLSNERANHTLQTTELVHEAYVRLVDGSRLDSKNRAHFFAVAARVMRHVLVDYARRRRRVKRFGNARRVPFDAALTATAAPLNFDFLALDVALSRLQDEMPDKVRILEMRFFGGMTHEEIGEVINIPAGTVRRHARYAQVRLHEMMREKAS